MAKTVSSPLCCEGCQKRRPLRTKGWYVDPEGVELCPECAAELRLAWRIEALSGATAEAE